MLAGCNQVFGIKDTQSPTAIDAPGCSQARFEAPVPLDLGDLTDAGDGELLDLQHLWFSQGPSGDRDIWRAQRASDSGPFDPPVREPNINTVGQSDFDPAITADGLDMFFVSWRTGSVAVYEATRTSLTSDFGPPLTVPAASTLYPVGGIDVSSDGLTLFVADNQGTDYLLRALHRDARDKPFGAPSAPLASNVVDPSVSPDQLELFFTPATANQGVDRLVRTTATMDTPFDSGGAAPEVVDPSYADPDVSPDSAHLIVYNSGFSVLTRICH